MKKWQRIAILPLVFVPGLTSQALGQTGPTTQSRSGDATQMVPQSSDAKANADRPVLQHRNPRYQVKRDDVLALSFPLSPELNQKVTVQPDGYITLPNIGGVYVLDMTAPEISDAVKKAYVGVLHDPIIDVDLADFQKPFFVALGQVAKPGQYDLRYDMTITQAVAVAGGFAPTAKTQLLLYHPISPTMMEVKKINIKDVLNGKNVNEEVHLSPGDMIFVPEKAITKFRKYVPYGFGAGYSIGLY